MVQISRQLKPISCVTSAGTRCFRERYYGVDYSAAVHALLKHLPKLFLKMAYLFFMVKTKYHHIHRVHTISYSLLKEFYLVFNQNNFVATSLTTLPFLEAKDKLHNT